MLNSTLYFSYTHLVCRTALSGEPWGSTVESPMGGGGVASGDVSLAFSLCCLVVEVMANSWVKSHICSVGTAVANKLGFLLLFVSPTLPPFSSLPSVSLSLLSVSQPSISLPINHKQEKLCKSDSSGLPFLPNIFFALFACPHHLERGQGMLPP